VEKAITGISGPLNGRAYHQEGGASVVSFGTRAEHFQARYNVAPLRRMMAM